MFNLDPQRLVFTSKTAYGMNSQMKVWYENNMYYIYARFEQIKVYSIQIGRLC